MPFLRAAARPLMFAAVEAVELLERSFANSEWLYTLLLAPGFAGLRSRIGAWRAWRTFYRAYATTPAYREYIDLHGGRPSICVLPSLTPDLSVIPETDKESYVKRYPIAARVQGGRLPTKGVMVDESSGSSGQPTSWVRGPHELRMTKQMMRLTYHRSVEPGQRVFILNAFALGAWATGMNVSMSLGESSILKSTGPNADKIVSTMLEFGPDYHYVIMGYPPFLKSLADDKRIDWSRYTADAGFGGEGVSESLRTYLLRTFKRVVGSYGASDLEINLAVETELTIRLRRAFGEDQTLKDALIRTEYGLTPMIFQYNPLAYHIETNPAGELVVTLARGANLAPKIRYNIHDRGHVMSLCDLKTRLKALGRADLVNDGPDVADLPLLFLYGRSDMSIDYYGAQVTPDSVREILYAVEALAPITNTFRLLSFEDAQHNKRMEVAVEMVEGATAPADAEAIAEEVFSRLAKINGDFYNALYRTATPDNPPALKLYPFGAGPFAGGQRKLKNEYVASNLVYDAL